MKKLIIPFLSFIALPSAIQANIDPKVAEMCMKASDFQGCVKSMSGKKENNLTLDSDFENALTSFRDGDPLKANKLIKSHLKKNPNSKEGYMLQAIIKAYDLGKYDDAIADIDKAIDIDNGYALAHAFKAEIFYWDLGGSLSKTLKYLEKGMNISPEDPHINFIAGDIYFDNGYVLLDSDKKDLALKSFEEASKSFEKTLANIEAALIHLIFSSPLIIVLHLIEI